MLLHKTDNRKTMLPIETPIALATLLADYVKLQDIATRKQIKTLADHTECPSEKRKLLALCSDEEESHERYRQKVLAKRKSLLDLLFSQASLTGLLISDLNHLDAHVATLEKGCAEVFSFNC